MPLSKEEAQKRGYKIKPIKHSMKRRADWNDYFMPGRYGVTVHLLTDGEGNYDKAHNLSNIVGSCKQKNVHVELTPLGMFVARKIEQIGMHPNYHDVKCIHSVIMPSHVHLTLEISKKLPVVMHGGKPLQLTLGHLIGSIKGGCTGLYKHWQEGDFADCTPGSEEWARRCDFGYKDWQEWKAQNHHSCEGNNSAPSPFAPSPQQQRPLHVSEGKKDLWEPNYNDKILNTTRKTEEWILYEDLNPYFWRLQDENPHLMQRRLHIDVKMRNDGKVVDFSAFGCIFLLRKGDRIQVQCTRLAEKGMLTAQEWAHFTQPEQVRKFEADREKNPLGGYRHDWLTNPSPTIKTPIPYELTDHFRRYKAGIIAEVRHGAIPVSPAVSAGEQEIFYGIVNEGYPVIKLSKQIFTPKSHPVRKDRLLCASGLMLVLGPWDMPRYDNYTRSGNKIDNDSDRAIFKDLNRLAERMCDQIGSLNLKEQLEEMEL